MLEGSGADRGAASLSHAAAPAQSSDRHEELAQLAALLEAGAPIITIIGPPGIGKTHLCQTLLQCSMSAYAWVDCHTQPLAELASLAAQRSLLVLDGADAWLPQLRPPLAALRRAAPELQVLVTTQEPLDLPDEVLLPLGPLPPQPLGPAQQLFLTHLAQMRPGSLALDQQRVWGCIRGLGGVPRLIITAARLVAQSPLLCTEGGEPLIRAVMASPPVRAIYDEAWGRLSPAAQRVLAALTVFQRPFTEAAAATVLAALAEDVRAELRALQRRSLLWILPAEEPRLCLDPVLRCYGEQRRDAALGAQLRLQHARYFAQRAQRERRQHLPGMETQQAEDTMDECSAALRWLIRQAPRDPDREELALRLVGALGLAGRRDSLPLGDIQRISQFVGEATQARVVLRVEAYLSLGRLHLHQRQYAEAEQRFRVALSQLGKDLDGPDELLCLAHLGVGEAYFGRCEGAAALSSYRLALARCPPGPLRVLLQLRQSDALMTLGQAQEAHGVLLEAAQASTYLGDQRLVAMAEGGLGCLALGEGRSAVARTHLQRALALLAPYQDAWLFTALRSYLAVTEWDAGHVVECAVLVEAALEEMRHLEDSWLLVLLHALRAAVRAAQGLLDDALRSAGDARRLCGDNLVLRTIAETYTAYLDLAEAQRLVSLGDPVGGRQRWLQALQHIEEIKARRTHPRGPLLAQVSDDVRIGLRHLQRAALTLRDVAVLERAPDSPAAQVQLTVGQSGAWFQLAGQPLVSLRSRPMLQRALWCLCMRQYEEPEAPVSTTALIQAIWIGEQLGGRTGANRLYVMLNMLRRLGLRDVLKSVEGGYQLAAAITIASVSAAD